MHSDSHNIELLAPGGDLDSIKAAIAAGADAVYCGLHRFNARGRAANITFEDLNGIIALAHRHSCKIFLTLNIIIVEREIRALIDLLNKLVNTSIDGVIIQDFGLFYLLSRYFKGLNIHASTQLTTHNEGQIEFLRILTASRVNLSRELNIHEIKALTSFGHKNGILTEIFVHGSYCLAFSGLCYISSVHGGNSGNRGRCSQPCRDEYLTTPEGNKYPLNLKDNSAYFDLREIAEAGVDSIKIEGRMKSFDYVYTVVNCWKKQLHSFYHENRLLADNGDLYKVFNRDFSNAYLQGDISRNMFIDNPRDHSIKHLAAKSTHTTNEEAWEKEQVNFYSEKTELSLKIRQLIQPLSIEKTPLIITISGEPDAPLKVSVKSPDASFIVLSEVLLLKADTGTASQSAIAEIGALKGKASRSVSYLNYNDLLKRLSTLNNSEYAIEHLRLDNLQSGLFLPFKEFTLIKKKILSGLDASRKIIDPIDVPPLTRDGSSKIRPTLAVLISSKSDLYLAQDSSAEIFFQLPSCFKEEYAGLIELFLNNKKLIPWFPSILIGEDYTAAASFLHQLQPGRIVTNNTGIAYEAYKKGIPWIAGPQLNLANSFSLLCLKEKLGGYGAFISNELSRFQIKSITPLENFKLYYSIYHPLLLLSSRQCLHLPVIGCEKKHVDDECMQKCNKSSLVTTLKNEALLIKKTAGNYHCMYDSSHYLNTAIVTDLPDFFSGFLVDLRDIETATKIKANKAELVRLFKNLLDEDPSTHKELSQLIHPTTSTQYTKGI